MRIIAIISFVFLIGCTVKSNDHTNYKIALGKKCSQDNTTFSYFWMIDVVGDEAVKKEYCK